MKKRLILILIAISTATLCLAASPAVRSQSAMIYITADGSVVGTNSILRDGDYYVFKDNITGSISVQRSNIILDGAGHTLAGYGGTGIDLTGNLTEYPSLNEIRNVTIENLNVLNFNWSINGHGSSYNTFYHDFIGNTTKDVGSEVLVYWNQGGYNITQCTITGAIGIELSSGNSITENNLSGMFLQLVGNETIDRNYWYDYLTKYSNATEVNSSGIGNTPYAIDTYDNRVVNGALQDNHPLMKPISIPNLPTILPASNQLSTPSTVPASTPLPTQSTPKLPTLMLLVILIIAIVIIAILFVRRKGRK